MFEGKETRIQILRFHMFLSLMFIIIIIIIIIFALTKLKFLTTIRGFQYFYKPLDILNGIKISTCHPMQSAM